jgi:2-haloacid dehalogenase
LSYLKKNYVVATLSNGNISMLIDIARHAGLSWDAVLSSELFRHYKPDRQNYLGAADLLGCRPDELMMVAAHPSDLRVARDCGLKTAFVPRPFEHGGENPAATSAEAGAFSSTAQTSIGVEPPVSLSLQGASGDACDSSAPVWDVTASDFLDLASQLS